MDFENWKIAVLALAFAAAGCTSEVPDKDPMIVIDDGMGTPMVDGGTNIDPGPPDEPTAVAEPEMLEFVGIEEGLVDVRMVTVRNIGLADLEITDVTLVELTTDDLGGEELEPADPWTSAATLATGESIELAVRYSPRDSEHDRGTIEVQTNDPTLDDGILQISVLSREPAPNIFARQNVVFQRVPPVNNTTRDTFWQLLEVQNIGESTLTIGGVEVSPAASDFTVSFPTSLDPNSDPANDATSPAASIGADESMPVRVYFNPTDDLPSTAELVIFSNDPDSPEYVVSLLGNSSSPCMQLSDEEEINFGEGGIGFSSSRTVVIENCSSTSDLNVSSIRVDSGSPIFGVEDLPSLPTVLAPQETANFVVTFAPDDLSVSEGILTVESNDPAKPVLEVPLIGMGMDNACPQAVAEARAGAGSAWTTTINTIPLNTIEFSGLNSSDPDGSIASYEWVIVQRPTNSTVQMSPSTSVAEPSLFLDLAGLYTVELRVFDDQGTQSCGTRAIIDILAVPDEDVSIQLVWDTPSDPDQTDVFGADMDLHLLHPDGTWNAAPHDIFWMNTTADWGAAGSSDDPTLDIDDSDGAGPENISFSNPEAGLTYAIGAYYYDDAGYGASYATLRVYVQGNLAFEYRDQFLPAEGDFWYVATLSWPSQQVLPVNQVEAGFPSRP